MTRRPHPLPPVPEATAVVVQAAFPKGNLYVDLRTEFGTLYEQDLFADLYADRGHPIEVAPWRLALVVVMQYIEGLTDRQAADAVRRCMDWKYALSLELTDAGFHFTLLHDFRQRLLAHDGAQRLLESLPSGLQSPRVAQGAGHATHRFHARARSHSYPPPARTGLGNTAGSAESTQCGRCSLGAAARPCGVV
jgi:transposase